VFAIPPVACKGGNCDDYHRLVVSNSVVRTAQRLTTAVGG